MEIFALQASKGNIDAKRNTSMHYKTSLTIIYLDLMWYYNMDGRQETTGNKKEAFRSTKVCAAIIDKK